MLTCKSRSLGQLHSLNDCFCLPSLLTGLVPSPGRSLFTYQSYESYNGFFDPRFTANFYPFFDSEELKEKATKLCDGDEFCLYDVAVTGQLLVGNLTKMTSERRLELIDLLGPSK